jgi:phosphatidylserine decarboxylase precursor
MNKTIQSTLLAVCFAAILASCNGRPDSEKEVSYGPATQELIAMVRKDTALKSMLELSIQKAKAINPDTLSNPAQTLDGYFRFVSKIETAMPWLYVQNKRQSSTFDHIFQSLCTFYFVIDQPLPALEGKGLYHPSLQYHEPFGHWLTTFNNSWRRYLDSTASWNDAYAKIVADDPSFGLQQGWYEDPANWKSFNQFFARHLSSPAARPIASPEDESVVVSFADAEPQGVWSIDTSSTLVSKGGVPVKSALVKQVPKLLGEDNPYKDAFAEGTFTHSFLNVNDYHRYHFPVSGIIRDVRIISGINPTGGIITWDAEQQRYRFDPSSVNWQMLETRGCVIVETKDYGLVALLPIGMAAVGSVNFEDNVKAGATVKKGDPLGYFLFGGSDFIVIFQRQVEFTLDAPKSDQGDAFKHQLMGERLGQLSKRKGK